MHNKNNAWNQNKSCNDKNNSCDCDRQNEQGGLNNARNKNKSYDEQNKNKSYDEQNKQGGLNKESGHKSESTTYQKEKCSSCPDQSEFKKDRNKQGK